TITQQLDNTNPGIAAADVAQQGRVAADTSPGVRRRMRRPLWWAIAAGLAAAALAVALWHFLPWHTNVARIKIPSGGTAEVVSAELSAGTVAGDEWSGNALAMKFCWCPPGE